MKKKMIPYKTALTLTFPPTQILLCFPQFFLLLVQDNRLSTLLSLSIIFPSLGPFEKYKIMGKSLSPSVHHHKFLFGGNVRPS